MSLFFDYSPLLILHLTLRRVVVVRYVLFPVHTPTHPHRVNSYYGTIITKDVVMNIGAV